MPTTLFDLISPEAFSSLWYWILTAIVWSRLSHAPLGVSLDLYEQAAAVQDTTLIHLAIARHLAMVDRLGVALTGGWGFALSVLTGLSVYGYELAQALLLILGPVGVTQLVSTRAARQMAQEPEPEAMMRRIRGLRWRVQLIGLAAIFVAALFGMVHNLQSARF